MGIFDKLRKSNGSMCCVCGGKAKLNCLSNKIVHWKALPSTVESAFSVVSSAGKSFDVLFSDLSKSNPSGTIYLYKTAKKFAKISLCSKECAYDLCIEKSMLVSVPDPDFDGQHRFLSPHVKEINKGLGNQDLLRSIVAQRAGN